MLLLCPWVSRGSAGGGVLAALSMVLLCQRSYVDAHEVLALALGARPCFAVWSLVGHGCCGDGVPVWLDRRIILRCAIRYPTSKLLSGRRVHLALL